ncbi:MAG: hypothetical protein PHC82_01465 [Candidatus Pacebacteria bacterium]|nr:hypothetical protein [Candidatus Paceibacterota bacterium]
MNSKTKQIFKKASIAVFSLVLIGQAFVIDTAIAGTNAVFYSTLGLKNRTQSTATWQASVPANPGDRIAFDVYYKNTLPDTIAQNAKIRLDFEDNQGGQMRFKAYAYADNASYVYSLGYVTISNSNCYNFTFDNTAKFYPNNQTSANSVNVSFLQSNSILVNIGQISGGDQYGGHVVFEGVISGSSQTQTPQFNNASNDFETLRVKNRTRGDTTWQSSVTANPGDRIAFDIYYHNTGEGSVAHNTKARLNFPTAAQSQISVNGYVTADNAVAASDTAVIYLNSGTANLNFDTIGYWYPHQSTVAQNVNVSPSYGTVEYNMGDIDGTCEDQGHFVFEAVLSGTSGNSNLSITKTVKNVTDGTYWSSSVNANPGEKVSYKIDIYSSGQTAAENVILKDTLPSNMSYSGNLYINGVYYGYSASSLASGINLGTINSGSTKTITFDATVYSDSYFGSSNTTLTNYAYTYATNVSQSYASAQVNVIKSTTTGGNLVLNKLVRNITRGEYNWTNSAEAYPGEVVDFYLRITNNSNTVASGVYVKDALPYRLNYYDNVKVDGSLVTGNVISGYYLGEIAPNSSKTVTFQAIVASADNFNFGYTTLTNTGTAYNSSNTSVDSAMVVVNKKAVAGAATEIPTGWKDSLMDYLILPGLLAVGLIVLFKDSLFKFDQCLVLRGRENRNYRSQRILDKKINQIREKENIK